jgi:hypothetical protein
MVDISTRPGRGKARAEAGGRNERRSRRIAQSTYWTQKWLALRVIQ